MKLIIALSILFFNNDFSLLNAKEITLNYNIKGMMCKMNCPDFIIQEASKVDGVKKCDVNFNNNLATITFDDTKVDKNNLAILLSKKTDNMYEIKLEEKKSTVSSWWDWLFSS